MTKHRVGLMWFEHDLRVQDHSLLRLAATETDQLICVYCVNPKWFSPNRYGLRSMGQHRWRFLQQSLRQLHQQLASLGQQLLVSYRPPLETIARLISQCGIDVLYRSEQAGYYEQQYWDIVRQRYPFLDYVQEHTHSLFEQAQLASLLQPFPSSFSKFRKALEQGAAGNRLIDAIATPLAAPASLPPPPAQLAKLAASLAPYTDLQLPTTPADTPLFDGGCEAGLTHLQAYFAAAHAQTYKQTRNSLDEFSHSTKFSPWLANGSLSPRQILAQLRLHEAQQGANDSTYWILFELLWREYFYWYARHYQQRLFAFAGISQRPSRTSFYAGRFQKWCQGNTPFPIVNACMKQLNATGYMSNRGRQLVASCLVHELGLDWRYGAAYFEQQLVDYEVAANWGNWQYLAGVGADPRGHRWFDLAKQTAQYDPQQEFIKRWQGDQFDHQLDHVDAADWPLS
ncbi:DASH family cryptochrome [Pseudidiomarina sp. PP-1MA]|uniref:Cryptochrome DASH n=1 Tax=Pseudidiomarina sp. PP-1MA TaxID=3237706 RepID=A0AB39X5E5_9GAMM